MTGNLLQQVIANLVGLTGPVPEGFYIAFCPFDPDKSKQRKYDLAHRMGWKGLGTGSTSEQEVKGFYKNL